MLNRPNKTGDKDKMFAGLIARRHKHGITFAPAPLLAFCADCPKKRPTNMWGEWYVVKRSVWESAWPGSSMKDAQTPMPMEHFLCIECLENRIGRMTRDDFDLRRNHNKPASNKVMSRRFRNRLSRRR